ncbi:SAP domain, partial [Dillenia turbinata]
MTTLLTYANPRLNQSPYLMHSPLSSSRSKFSRGFIVYSAVSSPEKKSRRKKQQPKEEDASVTEKGLRLVFMEELMERARNRDIPGVSEVIYDMIAAGLTPGPRSFHGLIVSHTLNGDHVGAMQSLRRELSAGLRPLHETFVALIRLFGSKGHATRGLEILAAMEKLSYDIRQAWLILVEELVRNNHLEDANSVFLKGAKGGLRATDELYDLLIEEDCKAGDHSNALTIAYEMEAAGRMATTFHFNCLLSVQATCGIPEIAFATFENMLYGEDFMKPDTESYNWVIQAYTRAESYDRVQDVTELLGMMVEDHKRLQPNVKTYALLVECFTKYCVIGEAIRHFRALKNFEGGTKVLHNEGNFGDPLSLYLRALCREGRIVDLLEALEAMAKDNQPIPPRAMILSRKYRTLFSSWIEPLQEEAELGYEVDYIARYIAEGGLTGERKRWVPRRGKTPLDPDAFGFIYSNPIETSFKQRCLEDWKVHHRKLLRTLRNEGLAALGDASESDYIRVEERLRKIVKGPDQNVLKPKAASKMIVSELKEELEAQGLPTDGTRNVLYQRVQKARRINRSRGRPLWVPPVEEEEEEVDEELDELISRIKLQDGNTEFWKSRFLGEQINGNDAKPIEMEDSEQLDLLDDTDADAMDDVAKEGEDDEADEEEVEAEAEVEVEVEPNENQVDRVKDKEVEAAKPPQMIGVQLLKDSEQETATSKKSRRKMSRISVEDSDDDDWFPEDIYEAFKEMRERKIFDVSDMYTLADAWGWTWERELKNRTPHRWSQEWEVELAIKIMLKGIELGGTPTIGDCAMILRAAIRAPLPSAFLKILQTTHSLGYIFGSPLYDEIISLCLDLGELDAAIAIVADMETTGITVSDQILDRVISARQTIDVTADDATSSEKCGKNDKYATLLE